jgi:hypothetical protein
MWTLFVPENWKQFRNVSAHRSSVWHNLADAKDFSVPITTNEAAQANSSFSTRADSQASSVF